MNRIFFNSASLALAGIALLVFGPTAFWDELSPLWKIIFPFLIFSVASDLAVEFYLAKKGSS